MAVLVILFFAVIGVLVGIVLRNNGMIHYGIGNQYGKHYEKDLGIENNDKIDRWDN